jgi:pyruvate dehydrogenase phosphatase
MAHRAARLLILPTASSAVLFSTVLTRHCFSHCDAPKSTQSKVGAFTYPANNPSEDRNIHGKINNWSYSAVFDGHGGWQVSDLASRRLIDIIADKLCNSAVKDTDEVQLDKIISNAFHDMEDEIITSIRPAFQLGFGEVAKVGSCVLIALHSNNRLIIANCGDCRAVLGSVSSDHQSYAAIINRDHNCRVPLEQELLKAKHPNEANLVVCKNSHACYVKGRLQLTRSLGDAYLKYHEFNGSNDKNRPRYLCCTYVQQMYSRT